jgi:hypothetical protein
LYLFLFDEVVFLPYSKVDARIKYFADNPLFIRGLGLFCTTKAAWQDYLSGRDTGITSTELKYKLFGDKLG